MNGSSAGVPPVMIACDSATVRTCWCSMGFRCNWRWRSGWVLCWLLALICLSWCGPHVGAGSRWMGWLSADCILLDLADGLRPLVVHCAARPLCAPPGCGVLARGPPVDGRRAVWSWLLGVRGNGELPALWGTGGQRGLRWHAMRLRSAIALAVWGLAWLRPGWWYGSRTVSGPRPVTRAPLSSGALAPLLATSRWVGAGA